MVMVNFGTSIGRRLNLGFGVILAILVAVLVADSVIGASDREALLRGIGLANAKLALTTVMKGEQLEGVVSLRSIGIYTEPSAMNKEAQNLKQHRQRFAAARDALMAMGVTEQGKRIFANIAELDKELEAPIDDVISRALGFDPEGVAKIIATRTDPIYRKMLVELNRLVELQKAEEGAVLNAATVSGRRLALLMLTIGVAAVVIGAILARMITNSIARPLNDAVRIAERVAEGDLTSVIEVSSRDEVGLLMGALSVMSQSLVKIVAQVHTTTAAIVGISDEIALGENELSARTEQQACSLEQTSSAMRQLSSTVGQNADNARQANELAHSASAIAVRGGAVVADVVATMVSINTSSRRIVDIIGVIDGIAFQTNILALNAAVEAARAGEQGRGFAVVAGEVRNLAQRSAAAAREIKHLIADSVERVGVGSRLVEQAGATMNDMVVSVGRVTRMVGEISVASAQQSTGIEQVHQALFQMEGGTAQNTALVARARASVQSLQEHAGSLAQEVMVFKLAVAPNLDKPDSKIGRTAAAVADSGARSILSGTATRYS
jgi:methyl-accepting chemotaxis protein